MEISVITPVYNRADTIAQCIRSIGNQTVSCQHLIIDGASLDGTVKIIEDERDKDSIFISEPDKGMYDAINKGLKLATGDIVGILNSDDFYTDDRVLARVLQSFENPHIDASYGDLNYVDRSNASIVTRKWRSGAYRPERFYNGWMPPHPTFFLRKHFYDKFGGYRIDMGSAADYELMLRMLLKRGAKATYIPDVLVNMRNEGMSNSSMTNRLKANISDRKAWKTNGLRPRFWTLWAKPLRKLGQWI